MITIFTTAKPFTGHSGVIQRNALKSWKELHADAEVILFGDEEGAAEAAREAGARHVASVERAGLAAEAELKPGSRQEPPGSTRAGQPKILRSFFDVAQEMARHELICYVNCDIVLPRDFLHAVNAVDAVHGRFLMLGRRWNVEIENPIIFAMRDWERRLTERAKAARQQSSGDWIDYFVFRRGLYLGKLPEMVIGRVYWDQWLVWKALQEGAAVVDATEAVMAIHQNHDYGYHPAGKTGVWTDEWSRRNYELAGGRWHLRTIDDATHVLGPDGLKANPVRSKRAAERVLRTAKEAAWVTTMDWTRPLRHAVGLRKKGAGEVERR